jgi:hypothetical protein
MDEELVIAGTFPNRLDAELARGALEAAGIESFISTDDAGGLRPDLATRFGVHVVVRQSQAAEASAILGGSPLMDDAGSEADE